MVGGLAGEGRSAIRLERRRCGDRRRSGDRPAGVRRDLDAGEARYRRADPTDRARPRIAREDERAAAADDFARDRAGPFFDEGAAGLREIDGGSGVAVVRAAIRELGVRGRTDRTEIGDPPRRPELDAVCQRRGGVRA